MEKPPRNQGVTPYQHINQASYSENTNVTVKVPDLDDRSIDKDETEIELEKLLFGDKAGFRDGLRLQSQQDLTLDSTDDEQDHDEEYSGRQSEDIEGVADADLFYLDSGPSQVTPQNDVRLSATNDKESAHGGRNQPAWEDSDDDRMTVSLASNLRLRKLRISEAEDLVNGKEYVKRLRRQYERLNPTPDWVKQSTSKKMKKRRRQSDASQSSKDDSIESDRALDDSELSVKPLAKLLQNADDLIRTTTLLSGRKKLRPGVIDIQRTKDIGDVQPSAVTCLSFHHSYPLLLSSGPSSTLYLHHISPHPPNPNPLVTSLYVKALPIETATFSGSRIFFSGRRRYFHIWDSETGKVDKVSKIYGHQDEQKTMEHFKMSPCGRWIGLEGSERKGGGYVNILDARTCDWIAQVRVDSRGGIGDFAWWGNGEGMTVVGKAGEVVEWDGRERRTVARWVDEGAVGTTVIALGGRSERDRMLGGDRWVALGSSSGIVNVYDRKTWGTKDGIPANPKPVRAFDQLTTPTSHLTFSPDAQILVIGSRWKKDALRLVHLPSCTVYRNWPTSSTPLGRVTAVAFTPNSEMLAIANEQGRIRLWEVRS